MTAPAPATAGTAPPASQAGAPRVILAFDCAGRALSVALGRDGVLLAARREERARGHGERLFDLIAAVLAEAGLDYADLDLIATTRGPGGFTGLRIGLAAARGLALAGGQPLFAATSFALAAAALDPADRRGRQVVAVIESKRAELFVQVWPEGKPFAAAPEHLDALLPPGPLALCGDGAERAAPALRAAGRDLRLPPAAAGLDAHHLLALAAAGAPGAGGASGAAGLPPATPLYLRPPDVTRPKPRAAG